MRSGVKTRSGSDMGVMKYVSNKIAEAVYVLDAYAQMAIGNMCRKYKMVPYVPSDEWDIFDTLGGFDMFNLFMKPKHIYLVFDPKIVEANALEPYKPPHRVRFMSNNSKEVVEVFDIKLDWYGVRYHDNNAITFKVWFIALINVINPWKTCGYEGDRSGVCKATIDENNNAMVEDFEKVTKRVISF